MTIKSHHRWVSSALLAISLTATSGAVLITDAQRNGLYAQSAPKLEDSLVFSMAGGLPLDVMKKCVDEGFTKKFNVRVDFLPSQPQAIIARIMAQRSSPPVDVMHAVEETDYAGFKEGLLVPITPSLIPNLANVDARFPQEPIRGAAWAGAILGIQYNTKIFKEKGFEPPTSWRDVWDPKYKGHVGIYNLGVGTSRAMLAVAGFLNGGDSKNYDAAFDYLTKLKPNLYTIFQQAAQFDAALAQGNAWLGFSFSLRPLAMMQDGNPVGFVQPKEGIVFSKVTLSIVKNSPHPNAAAAFVNWMLSEEAQSCLPRAGYAPVIKGFDVPAEMAPFLKVQGTIIPVDWGHIQENLPKLILRWNKEMDG